ncbi:virulence RhuM family protein [Pelotalea chapellei]|uniref:Virulence RhuM family protein n=1 Tax=Pelotalea chapellei TaxID=44671 RepID=A0ABS5UCT1_9BACT|nr:virulence RhuM family protein [Pelotalea chapellei]MBT1073484.1 virulence RhuM family protein [Pelotalea chapellei]
MTKGELIIYTTDDGNVAMQLRVEDGTVWMSQMEMTELFQSSKQNVSLHIKNILEEGELKEEATVKESLTVQIEGTREVKRQVQLYNLDMILAVGYRVRSQRGTQFRQWATSTLHEYLVKGFVMDDKRLKEPGGWDYFDELLERIRDIRASEKRFYQKVRDIFATSIDYNPKSDDAQLFFKKVQNKMLWAITGHTAPEIISGRSNPALPNMGVMSWEGGRVRKKDVTIAKNYLNHDEIEELNRIVTMYLDYAEDQAKRRKRMTMQEWSERLDAFLSFNERNVLTHAGHLKSVVAEKLVLGRYEEFDAKRRESERLAADDQDTDELEQLKKITLSRKKEANSAFAS